MADDRTLITDVVVPEIYLGYGYENSPETTALFESGVAVRDASFDRLARQGGTVVNMHNWGDIDQTTEPHYSDDSMTKMEPDKIVANAMRAHNAYLNHALRAPDIISELTGSDPMQRIRNRFGVYWQRQWQRRILAMLRGIYNDNVANDDGDMVYDASTTNILNDDDAKFSNVNFLNALATSGDRQDNYRVIAVHSHIYSRMKLQNQIASVVSSDGKNLVETYLGLRVVVDDLLTIDAAVGVGDNDAAAKYYSIIFGSAAIAYGEGTPRVPVYVEREEREGNGGGMEVIGERKTMLIHPYGFDFTATTITPNVTPNLADLKLAANWDRAVDRKNIPLAFLVTNN